MRNGIRLVAVAAVLALLSGCTLLSPAAKSTPTGEQVASDLKPFYEQELAWHSCETGMQCATAKAPLDWDKPIGDTIELALIRKKATGTSKGSLFVNPGGPGGSGYDLLSGGTSYAVDSTLQKNFDIVSWDPRGVGRSSAVKCGTAKDLDHYYFDLGPDDLAEEGTDAWFDVLDQYTSDFAAKCLADTGPLLGHLSTLETAKDLDMLRAAVGDTKLNYLGYSYGTLIGAIYAEAFPKNTGRLVLDGAVDPAESAVDISVSQSKGFESALRAYLASCLAGSDCPFTGTVDDAVTRISTLLDTLDDSPIRNDDGRELDGTAMTTAIDFPLYSEDRWTYLDQLFTDVFSGSAAVAFSLVDAYYDRDANGTYATNLIEAFTATNCLDYPEKATRDETRAEVAKVKDEAPLFGSDAGYAAYGCTGWPFDAVRTPGPIAATGSSDILVLGTTNDPATPYANAVALASQLENGHLVSYTGEGHTAYNGNSTCIDAAVDAYFVDGTVPATDPQC